MVAGHLCKSPHRIRRDEEHIEEEGLGVAGHESSPQRERDAGQRRDQARALAVESRADEALQSDLQAPQGRRQGDH